MYRKIIVNLFIGLILPIVLKIRWLPDLYNAIFKGIYKYYDLNIESLREFLFYLYFDSFVFEYFILLLFVLLPFQLIKDINFNKKKKRLSFLKKVVVLSLIFVVCMLLFIPLKTEYLIYYIFSLGYGLFFTSLLYLLIDRYEEK